MVINAIFIVSPIPTHSIKIGYIAVTGINLNEEVKGSTKYLIGLYNIIVIATAKLINTATSVAQVIRINEYSNPLNKEPSFNIDA